ncbi:lipid IV(A) 3-deoxy-D-manno-octulosonic acid transferase [Vibrio sinaloensis]|uniref:3-deoxy-D-manno-octulosonic acid transferase n=1 Tax=Photobacterium sp. (strain ATCC 43367) TaxID=379097 RepID=A0A0A5JHN8_PHOS4|nr:lipid IV(A) 3-deoxy-D-manno-octulosonic acid transferase [Vibrio sinaloensis]KGY07463.1 3-deoxy-D-manno-octulosonic acid transferase [Vibrio sinaloensis]
MLIRFLYTILLAIVAPLLLYGLYKPKTGKPKYGLRWKEHFGLTPKVDTTDSPIWIHAVSVGEAIAAVPLIRAIKEKDPKQVIVVTTTTSTGAAQIKKIADLVEHRYMPIDFSFAVKGFLRAIKPSQMLIMETELWPNTLHTVAKYGIPITVINARLSHKSYSNYKRVLPLFSQLSKHISHICCQNKDDAERFIDLGICDRRVSITGSIKFDIVVSEQTMHAGSILKTSLGQQRPIWIAASTHKGEDEQVIAAHKSVLQTHQNSLLIIVPRHPERFEDVFLLCQSEGLKTVRRTSQQIVDVSTQIYLADTMGELLTLFSASDICFMGGSLLGEKVGGHNVLEPIALGVPTITGPSYYNFLDIVTGLKNQNAIRIADDANMLANILQAWFSDTTESKAISLQAHNFLKLNSGAIERTLNRLGYE